MIALLNENFLSKKSNQLVSRDIQCIICSFIHQMFIENANLAELVHFQVKIGSYKFFEFN